MTLAITYDDKRNDVHKAGDAPPRLEHIKRSGKLAFDASYPNTGGTVGEPLTAAMLQLSEVVFVDIPPNGGFQFQYDYDNSVVHVFQQDIDAVADGPLVQIANAVDLSALTAVHFEVVGKVAPY